MSMFEIDIASGTVVRQEELPPVDADIECGKVHYGIPDPGGGWVFTACGGHLVFVTGDGEERLIRAPTYTDELPSARDIADWRERNRARGRAGIDEDNEALEEFRNTRRSTTSPGVRSSTNRDGSGSPPSGIGTNSPTWTSICRARGRTSGVSGSRIESWDSMWLDRLWRSLSSGRRRRTTPKGSPPARSIGTTSGSGGRGALRLDHFGVYSELVRLFRSTLQIGRDLKHAPQVVSVGESDAESDADRWRF